MIELIASIAGLIVPPAFDFIKKKFLKPKSDSPEATMSTLAVSKPEVLDKFILANVELLKAKKDFFNRDVVGEPSRWVIDLRASIRPLFVVISLALTAYSLVYMVPIDKSFKTLMDLCISSWFSSRLL